MDNNNGKSDSSVEIDGFKGEYMGSLELENGKTVGFLCKDGSVRVLP